MGRSSRRVLQSVGVLAGALVAVAGASIGAGAAASHTSSKFAKSQAALEQQISNRQSQLARLSADVKGSTTLTSSDALLLSDRLANETASIDALASKVPTDSTWAELRADRATMIRANRVYAVMTPQVFQTIEADATAAQVTMLQGEETSLLASVNAIMGESGYRTAAAHYRAFVSSVQSAARDSADVITRVLAQVPADFPGDTTVFVNANHRLLNADIAIAHADYDANVIGLATGGYTGS